MNECKQEKLNYQRALAKGDYEAAKTALFAAIDCADLDEIAWCKAEREQLDKLLPRPKKTRRSLYAIIRNYLWAKESWIG